MKISEKMFTIFAGRCDSYGQDTPKDGDPAGGGRRVDETLSLRVLEGHLSGVNGIGVYPTHHDADGVLWASWGCCDIDTGDWSEAYALATALRAMKMVPHIERSRSKGWHVWVFPTEPVEAWEMRRALKVAYAAIELPAKEANPKSEQLKPGQVGNYVRLPYKGALGSGGNPEKQTFMVGWDKRSDGFPMGATDWFYDFDESCQTDAKVIREWATRFKEPQRKLIVDIEALDESEMGPLVQGLPGDLLLFVKNGPQSDRSAGLVALGYKLRSAGYTAKEIYSLLQVADQVWGGKYSSRADGHKWLVEIVERVVQ